MAIGETILGAVLQVVFDRLASQQVLNFFKASKIDQTLVNKLKRRMEEAEKLLADAEQKQFTERAVKRWLADLKHLFYQAEDIADEISTEALRSSLEAGPESLRTKVRNWNPFSSSSSFATSVNSKMSEVVTQLDDMVSRSGALNLREGSVNMASTNRESTSFIPLEDAQVFGRDEQKKELLNFLLPKEAEREKEAERNRISVFAIVGMPGMGKTTLAKFVYNDESMGSFDLKAWVYVSDHFDFSRVFKSILLNITGQAYSDFLDLEFLCRELRGKLQDKRFFLVLDDVWNEKYEDWKTLHDQLSVCAHGSKIIVTARNDGVASIMCTVPVMRLRPLSLDDGWSLFSKHAFEVGSMNSDPRIASIGRKIVHKCQGLPLAIKTLGGLLRCKERINEWEVILQSSLWDLPIGMSNVAPALWLSYYHLPSHLKQCFSYCAVFPKGFRFEKRTLVLLWMAENFVQSAEVGRREEDVGEDYLNQLLSRSFFDKSCGDFVVMHDLMHDLIQAVSGEFFARLEHGETAALVPEKARYFSYFQDKFDVFTKFEGLLASKHLRTFIPMSQYQYKIQNLSSKISLTMIPQFNCLHVLSLSNYDALKLPESIGNLKQLRYLDVSRSKIIELPETVCSLCHLQTLLLSGCQYLERLPAEMSRLVSLRHLEICGTRSLQEMPKHMSKLKSLQTLSGFVVSKHCDQGIEELREMRDIRGRLALRSLQNVSSPVNAIKANLSCKEYVKDVALEFDEKDIDDSVKGREVVENLKPHTNLERLTFTNYPGTQFPSWLNTECSMYKSIVQISLIDCKYCLSLPPLGRLPCLRSLQIMGMEHIETIGSEFYGYESGEMNPFPALELLVFEDMKMWKEWLGHETEGRLPFPCLKKLRLQKCPELEGELPAIVASLKDLTITECDRLKEGAWQPAFHLISLELFDMKELVRLPPQLALFSYLEHLDLWGLEKLKSLEHVRLPTNLRSIHITECKMLECLPKDMDLLNRLQDLDIRNCPILKWACPLHESSGLPTSLRFLNVLFCKSFEFPIPMVIERMQRYSSLESLWISESCRGLVSFPLGAFPNLHRLILDGLRDLQTVYIPSESQLLNLTSLEILRIKNCRKLNRIGKTEVHGVVDLPTPNLTELLIVGCGMVKPLTRGREGGLPSTIQELTTDDTDDDLLTSLIQILTSRGREGSLPSTIQELTTVDDLLTSLIQILTSRGREGSLPSTIQVLDTHDDFNDEVVRNPRSLHMFSCLTTLTIHDFKGECFPESRVSLPITIESLTLLNFPNLRNLNGEAIQTLTSLRELFIAVCLNLECLPDEGLPSSLGSLHIVCCPLVEERCKRDKGLDWPKIQHIPKVYFTLSSLIFV